MDDPGLERHEWESEWQTLEDDLRTDPTQALPELDRLVARMLEQSGYELTDPIAGDESEIVEAVERDPDEVSLGDVASAVTGLRAVFDTLVATRATADATEVEET